MNPEFGFQIASNWSITSWYETISKMGDEKN